MKPVVRFNNVSKKYNLGRSRTSLLRTVTRAMTELVKPGTGEPTGKQALWALRNVSFELGKGESLGLIGRNGAGKSTILKLLAQITRPTRGAIDIDGRVSALIELGSGFHSDLTGRENIYLNGTILGLKRHDIDQRFEEIVAFSELEQFIDTPVKRYSSGMLVRLGFAVASCIEPEILLVDEVLAVGDASFRHKCLERIESLLEYGTSIIFVSHNLYMVQAVCPVSLYVERGQVKLQGKTKEVIDAYEHDLHEEKARQFAVLKPEQANDHREVQITRIDVLDAEGASASTFHTDQSVEIRVHYQLFGSPRRANAVIRLTRTDGVTCCMMRTALDNVDLSLQPGAGSFSIVLDPLQLTGGTFFVDARITNAMDSAALALGWSDWFYVSGSGLSHEEESGVFEPRHLWKDLSASVVQTVL
jgi:lipopolysaccharide transport system ATP-binding protein